MFVHTYVKDCRKWRKENLAFWAKRCLSSKSRSPKVERCSPDVSLPPVHPASSVGQWPWVCWLPDAGSARWAQALGTREPPWAAGHVPGRAWMWKALHLPGWSPWGCWAGTQHKQTGRESTQFNYYDNRQSTNKKTTWTKCCDVTFFQPVEAGGSLY